MNGSFTEVKPLFYWVQHILPLVYDDSLSYMELLGKVTKTLNELVENNNLLPDYIMKLIKEYISSGEIEKVLAEVLANYMLNVKFPPKGLTPAVGDGSADDTEAIQGCINYAYQNGGMAVYFPSGAYLTQPLTLNEKVTLFGQDRYTTRIVMKGGATKPLFTGTVDEMSLTGLGFDGNMDIQVNNVNLFTITVNSAIITNCLLTDGYDLLNITVNNELQLDNILFRHAVENALVVGGAGYVQGDNLIFKSLSTLIGKNYIVLNTNKSILEEVKCFGAAPNGVLIGGNSNVVNMWCEACQTPYVDKGTNNTIHVYGASEDEKFTGDVTQYIGGFLNQTVGATKKLVSRNVIDTAGGTRQESTTGNKTETVNGNDTETVGGDKKETVNGTKSVIVSRSLDENIGTNKISSVKGTKTETITGLYTENANGGKVLVSTDYNENVTNKNVTAAKVEETLTGNKTVTAANMIESITGDKEVSSQNYNETVRDNKTTTANNLTENITNEKNFTANSLHETLTTKMLNVTGNNTETLGSKTEIVNSNSKEIIGEDKKINAKNIILNDINIINYLDGENVKNYGAKGDGITDDTLAFNNAIVESLNKNTFVYVPDGIYFINEQITDINSANFIGSGRIKTNTSNNYYTLFYTNKGDRESLPVYNFINNPDNPTSGYMQNRKIEPINFQTLYFGGAHNTNVAGNGRTGYSPVHIENFHYGEGDCGCVNLWNFGAKGRPLAKESLECPGVILVNGEVQSTVENTYLNPFEFVYSDNLHKNVLCVGWVANFNRTGINESDYFWLGSRMQNKGNIACDSAYQLVGGNNNTWKIGFDSTRSPYTKHCLAMTTGQRISFNISSDGGLFNDKYDPNDCYMCHDNETNSLMFFNDTAALKIGVGGELTIFGTTYNKNLIPSQDNQFDLGATTNRYKNIYATNGTIVTSDKNSKTDINDIDEKIFKAWDKISFKVFKMKDSIKEKGEKARKHIGVIAQDIISAFDSVGLNALEYGLVCYEKWDDKFEERKIVDKKAEFDKETGIIIEKEQSHYESFKILSAGELYSVRYDEVLALECAYSRWKLEKLEKDFKQYTSF